MTRGNPSTLVEANPDIGKRNYRRGKEPLQEPSSEAEFEDQESENMAEQEGHQRTLSDYAKPSVMGTQSSIVRPPITAHNFVLKPGFI